jgi:hypothetical protein
MQEKLQSIWQRLHDYCRAQNWQGVDPYDALTAPIARHLPGKLAKQVWTQIHRRTPVNFRAVCGIRPQENATALALFYAVNRDPSLRERLLALRNPDGGWGYPFPWQSRAFYAPAHTSNLICTFWASRALGMDAQAFVERQLLHAGWIGYIAGNDTQVHNINMLGAALIGRRDCMEFSVRRQNPDGSWWYGEAANQRWIDNFHTGYCLVALRETGWFPEAAQRGFDYWDRTFWGPDFAPHYYHDRPYPFDTHCCAQGILTYLAFGQRDKADAVARWAMANMWDERGFFWYQRSRWLTNRLCYIRWTQAWMYYALAQLIKAHEPAPAHP